MKTAAVVWTSEEHAEGFATAEMDDWTGGWTASWTAGDGTLCG
jgi:hypothetical protein